MEIAIRDAPYTVSTPSRVNFAASESVEDATATDERGLLYSRTARRVEALGAAGYVAA